MKKIIYCAVLFAISSALVLSGCDSGGGETPVEMTAQQKATKALKAGSPWVVESVDGMPDGSDVEAIEDLQLTFGASGSELTIAPSSFASTAGKEELISDGDATWKWDGDGISKIILTDGFTGELKDIEFSPSAEAPTSVTLTFILSDDGGRVSGLGGYTITFQ